MADLVRSIRSSVFAVLVLLVALVPAAKAAALVKPAASDGAGARHVPTTAADSSQPAGKRAGFSIPMILVGGGFSLGSSNGYGSIYSLPQFPGAFSGHADDSIFAWQAGLSVDVPLVALLGAELWVEGQVNLVNKGRYFEWNSPPDTNTTNDMWVREEILYFQIPAMAKIWLTLTPGLSLSLAAGPALNLAVAPGGAYWDYSSNQYSLPSSWYSGSYLNTVVLSAVGQISVGFGLGNSLLALFAKVDYDLTGDFNYGTSDTSHFLTVTGGLTIYFPIYLQPGYKEATTPAKREPPPDEGDDEGY